MPIINGKSLGSKKPLFDEFSIPLPPLDISTGEVTLRRVIDQIVRGEVAAFRERQSEQPARPGDFTLRQIEVVAGRAG